MGQRGGCPRPCRAGSSFHPTRLPRCDQHHLLHPQHPSRARRAAAGPASPCRCTPLVSRWGTVDPAAFSLCPRSQLTPSPPPLCFLSSCPQPRGAKSRGQVGKGSKGMEPGGTAGGCSGGGWAVGSDGEVQLPLLFLWQLLTWLDVVVLDEAVVVLSLQVGSTRHGVALVGPPT